METEKEYIELIKKNITYLTCISGFPIISSSFEKIILQINGKNTHGN